MSKEYLYDSMGYGIQIDVTKTYNPSKEGKSVDTRDLGVLLCYLGAVHSEHDGMTYEKDPYVLSKLDFPYKGDWNYHALKGFYLSLIHIYNIWETLLRQKCKRIVIYGDSRKNEGAIRKASCKFDILQMEFENQRGTLDEIMLYQPDAVIPVSYTHLQTVYSICAERYLLFLYRKDGKELLQILRLEINDEKIIDGHKCTDLSGDQWKPQTYVQSSKIIGKSRI